TRRPGPPPKNLFTGGWLGRQYDPFATGGAPRNEDFTARVREAAEEDFHLQALQAAPGVDGRRLAGRQSLRQQLESALRRLDSAPDSQAVDQQYRGAFQMLMAPAVGQAFDLRCWPAAVRERYRGTQIGPPCLLVWR